MTNYADFRDGDIPNAAKNLLVGLSQSAIPEDTIFYWIFVSSAAEAPSSVLPNIEELLGFASQLSKDYIWHNESFRLCLKS